MNIFKSLGGKAKAFVTNTTIKTKRHLPEIALVAGVTLTIASTIYACKQTMKLNDILDEHHERIDKINNVKEGAEYKNEDGEVVPYDDSTKTHDKICVYRDTTLSVIKLYILPAVGMAAGEALKIYAFISKKKEAVMYASIANAATATLNQYRERWAERVGAEEEANVFYDRDPKREPVVTENPDGTTSATHIEGVIPVGSFTRIFSPATSKLCDSNLRYMMPVLQSIQEDYNDRLSLNEEIVEVNRVLDRLGIDKVGQWMTAGWTPRDKDGRRVRIDFGLDKYKKPIEEGGMDFEKDGYFILEFNCEYIADKF